MGFLEVLLSRKMLYPNTEELRQKYLRIMDDPDFKKEFKKIVGRLCGKANPLYYANNLSAYHNTKIYLKTGGSLSYRCS